MKVLELVRVVLARVTLTTVTQGTMVWVTMALMTMVSWKMNNTLSLLQLMVDTHYSLSILPTLFACKKKTLTDNVK